jgi:hypothetical protein
LISGLILLAIPIGVSSYDVRYTVPAIDLLAAGASFGLAVIAGMAATGDPNKRITSSSAS